MPRCDELGNLILGGEKMDLEEVRDVCIISLGIILICLAVTIPICICVSHNKDRDVELEKYKIEMQIKHGDIEEVK